VLTEYGELDASFGRLLEQLDQPSQHIGARGDSMNGANLCSSYFDLSGHDDVDARGRTSIRVM
jgi:hypothetical protein